MSWGGRCPACKQAFTGKGKQSSRVMGQHRMELFLPPFSNRRESCPYSGGTVEDAAAGITPARRRRMNREQGTGQA